MCVYGRMLFVSSMLKLREINFVFDLLYFVKSEIVVGIFFFVVGIIYRGVLFLNLLGSCFLVGEVGYIIEVVCDCVIWCEFCFVFFVCWDWECFCVNLVVDGFF